MLNFIASNMRELKEFLLSIEGGVFLFGKICFLVAVVLAVASGDQIRQYENFALPASPTARNAVETEQEKNKPQTGNYDIIAQKNLFGEAEKPKQQEVAPKKSDKQLKLRLVGINLTTGDKPFAIIEETAKSQQEVFELNEKVFDAATLTKILPQKVELKHDTGLITLYLEEGGGETAEKGEGAGGGEQTEFSVSKTELDQELANLPRLLSQARAVPYFRNGQSIGMRLFAIRKDSMYDKLGLKNGDIIKTINDSSLGDPSEALKLFNTLRDERSIYLTVERNGEELDLRYSIN